MKHILLAVMVMAFMLAAGADDTAGSTVFKDHSLKAYLSFAEKNNPELKSSNDQWQAARFEITQKKALPDLMAGYSFAFQKFDDPAGTRKQTLSLMQPIPFPGKLGLAGRAASDMAEKKRLEYESKKLDVFYRVKRAYYDYYYLGRALTITRSNTALVREWFESAKTRYASASIPYFEINRLEIEIGRLEDREKSLEQKQWPLDQRLKALLGSSDSGLFPFPDTIVADTNVPGENALYESVIENNPDLAALNMRISAAERAVRLARMDYLPDFSAGLEYMADKGPDTKMAEVPLMAMVSVNLPIGFRKRMAAAEQARAEARMAGHDGHTMMHGSNHMENDVFYHFRTK